MGLWLLQRCLSKWSEDGEAYSYDRLERLASEAPSFKCIVDPDNQMFLNPPDMPAAIVEFCKKTKQPFPEKKSEFIRCVHESLALKYRFIIDRINAMRPELIEMLHIVGGGSQNILLNQLSANATGLTVVAGPVEATAVGNILVQAVTKEKLEDINDGRRLVARSFPLNYYEPKNQDKWDEVYEKVKGMFL